MNRPLRHIAIFCGLLMLALLIRANWLQYAPCPELASDENNRRVQIDEFATPRGDIVVGGQAITGSTEVEGTDLKYQRTYTEGPMYAPVTGYASQAQGMTLLENTYDSILSGQDERLAFQRPRTSSAVRGGGRQSVVTTIDPKAQKAGWDGLSDLKGARGAVVALGPQTGKVLALVSTPSYDPSGFAGNSFKEADQFAGAGRATRTSRWPTGRCARPTRRARPQDPHRRRGPGARASSRTSTPAPAPSPRTRCRSPSTRSAARPATRSATRRR